MIQSRPILPSVSDKQVMYFFTKPDCNLTYDNVKRARKLTWLADYEDEYSMANAIRCMLSPTGFYTGGPKNKEVRSKLVDDKLAFIPLLSNTLKSASGHPAWNTTLATRSNRSVPPSVRGRLARPRPLNLGSRRRRTGYRVPPTRSLWRAA